MAKKPLCTCFFEVCAWWWRGVMSDWVVALGCGKHLLAEYGIGFESL